jgi:hypothetical protein
MDLVLGDQARISYINRGAVPSPEKEATVTRIVWHSDAGPKKNESECDITVMIEHRSGVQSFIYLTYSQKYTRYTLAASGKHVNVEKLEDLRGPQFAQVVAELGLDATDDWARRLIY